ncbi:IclR family transcriptional regulator [Pontiella sulfatireligans]|uniref:HTH-type transcriptional regulator SrpS n=1 Tax=Pontiella sulfatireligans TaxID=2750658 RepID=A0A6C2UG43_9BACT|nr:helix-turn-helix domain-containing protein [Pontiella sulfatireligans]VGO19088.1 HTH-type transcriptional regulator SrpS [Pontiella sulfatireligans]
MDRSTSLIKALDILSVLARQTERTTLPALIETMNLPRSTVVRVLNTLIEYGLVEKKDKQLCCTPAFNDWAQINRYGHFKTRYRKTLETLHCEIGELVLIGIQEGNGVVHVDYIESDHQIRVAPAPVTRHNLRHNALGKLVLSKRPDLAEEWSRECPDFAKELESIRRTGVAWNREESVPGMIALACYGFSEAPTEPMIAVAWPVMRFSEEKGAAAIKTIQSITEPPIFQ